MTSFHSAKVRENWIYGKNPVVEVLRANRRKVFEIFVTDDFLRSSKNADLVAKAEKSRARISVQSSQALQKKVGDVVHQNIVARVGDYPYQNLPEICDALGENELILALDEITDPQNFATLCRSSLAFGVRAIIVPQDRSVLVTSAVCKASAGAVEHANIAVVVNLSRALLELKEQGFWIYGTTLKAGSQPLGSFVPANRSVLVMGSEGFGLRPLVEKNCDQLVHIPMRSNFDSLNVAQAGTVCLYEFSKILKGNSNSF